MKAINTYFLKNGTILPIVSFEENLIEGVTIYEIIRIIEGIPLFFDDHLKRLFNSLTYQSLDKLIDIRTVKNDIMLLLEKNKKVNGNIRYEIVTNKNQIQRLAYYIPHFYPPNEWYTEGSDLVSLKATRPNPNNKIWHTDIKQRVDNLIANSGAYEIVLVNEVGQITEGSRSNLFFIIDDCIYTAPHEIVLNGITRNYILEIISRNRIPIIFEPIHYEQLFRCTAAFLTGTSPGVLPIKSIDQFPFDPKNRIIQTIMSEYSQIVTKYITSQKSNNL